MAYVVVELKVWLSSLLVPPPAHVGWPHPLPHLSNSSFAFSDSSNGSCLPSSGLCDPCFGSCSFSSTVDQVLDDVPSTSWSLCLLPRPPSD